MTLVSGPKKKEQLIRVPARDLLRLERDCSRNARDAKDAWMSYCSLKTKLQSEILRLNKRNDFLVDEINTWKVQFEKFQVVAQDLTTQSLELKQKIEAYKVENQHLSELIKDREIESHKSSILLKATQKDKEQLKDAIKVLSREKALVTDQLKSYKAQNQVLLAQRAEVETVLVALRTLIETQPAALAKMLHRRSAAPLEEKSGKTDVNGAGTILADVLTPNSQAFLKREKQPFKSELFMESHLDDPDQDGALHKTTADITDLINRVTNDCLAALDNIKDDDQHSPSLEKQAQKVSSSPNVDSHRLDRSNGNDRSLDNSSFHPGFSTKASYEKVTASMPEIRV